MRWDSSSIVATARQFNYYDDRCKPKIALELVERAVEMEIPFRAVVADILYGEHRKFKEGLEEKGIP